MLNVRKGTRRLIDDNFLSTVSIDHGPLELLGNFVLEAQSEAQKLDLTLSLGTFEELLSANQANSSNWRPLFPVFDCRHGGMEPHNSFCVFGRDGKGDVVVCHAARLYDWPTSTCFQELSSMRMFYPDPLAKLHSGESCVVTAKSTNDISGRVIFSGAAWIRPDYRGKGLHAIFPRLGKVLAYGRWGADTIISMMAEDVQAKGFAPRFGYTNIDWEVTLTTPEYGRLRLAFLSMSGDDLFAYVRHHLSVMSQVDPRIASSSA